MVSGSEQTLKALQMTPIFLFYIQCTVAHSLGLTSTRHNLRSANAFIRRGVGMNLPFVSNGLVTHVKHKLYFA